MLQRLEHIIRRLDILESMYIRSQMTIEEKAALLSGKNQWESMDYPRLEISSLWYSDGPHGIRKQEGRGDHLGLNESIPATCFPTAATVANSWDLKLAEEIGEALGREARKQNVDVLLGPGLNIKRSPLCGRNFEYFSEDPFLSGKMAAAYIRGIQSQGVAACPKHFAVNSQETRRMAMNAVIDERTLRELYLTGFKIAIDEGKPWVIMTSYNQINGIYANENEHLLKDILRDEWGYKGVIVSDWGGSNDHVKGVAAGSDLEMPYPGFASAREIVCAVKDGTLPVEKVDACVDRILDLENKIKDSKEKKEGGVCLANHYDLAVKAAAESTILLKNEDTILPLKKGAKVAVIGDFAFHPRYQGAGSSRVNVVKVHSLAENIEGYDLEVIGKARGYHANGKKDNSLIEEAIQKGKEADIVLYCFGLDENSESEGIDRSNMQINSNQIELLKKLAEEGKKIVGILSGGSAIEMPWEKTCKAILHSYLGGEGSAEAILQILTGKCTPSAKLAETYPMQYEDTPAYYYYPAVERNSEYRESLFVGYRYYETAGIPVRYPFGYGLSYTKFGYSNLQIVKKSQRIKVVFEIKNTGDYDGAEICQMYVRLSNAKVFRPDRELKGFCRIFLKKGEKKTVELSFDENDLRYWNVKTGKWEIEGGKWEILIGASSMDIRLLTSIQIKDSTDVFPYERDALPHYKRGLVQKIEREEYKSLLEQSIDDGHWSRKLDVNDTIGQMVYAKSRIARIVYKILDRKKQRAEKKGENSLNILFIYNMPFRAIAKMSNGIVDMYMVKGILKIVNGSFIQGMFQVIFGFIQNKKENQKFKYLLYEAEKEE